MPVVGTIANASVAGLRGSALPVQWVSVGDSGALYTSSERTPTVWTSRTSSFGSTNINSVATDGLGTWVTVGASGKIASSTDGITWTQRTSQFSTSPISWVAYGGGTWVASGNAGKLSTSTDGVTWTAVAPATSGWSTSYAVGNVAYGNGVWVGVNANGTVRTATDPTGAWTSRTNPLGSRQHWCEYNPSLAIWSMGGESSSTAGMASSTNGTTWTTRNIGGGVFPSQTIMWGSNSSTIVSSTSTSGTWQMNTSTNGTTWSNVTEPTVSGTISGTYPALSVRGYGEDILVGVNSDVGIGVFAYLWMTTDGSTFTSVQSPLVTVNHLAHRNGHQSIR